MEKLRFLHTQLITTHLWVLHLLILLGALVVLTSIVQFIHRRVEPKLEKTHHVWDNTLLDSAYRPLLVFIWLFGLSYAVEVVVDGLGTTTPFEMNLTRTVIFLASILWFGLRYIGLVQKKVSEKINAGLVRGDNTSVQAVGQISRVTLIVIVALITLQSFGISISALLAFGGIGGLAVGFAAKDTLANFLGGMMIFFDRPFSVGDWINSPDRNIEGTVDHIGWRLTRIITFDKRPLYVPNGVFSNVVVCNPSRMFNRRIYEVIGLRYQDADKVAAVTHDIEEMLRAHPEIDQNATLMVYMNDFGQSSLEIVIYTFTKTTNWVKFQMVQQEIFLKVIEIVHAKGADFAFPTRTLIWPEQSTAADANLLPTIAKDTPS